MSRVVVIDYTNWKGERSLRRIEPQQMVMGSNEWHPKEQWLLLAWDIAKASYRHFAMKDIHMWAYEDERIPE